MISSSRRSSSASIAVTPSGGYGSSAKPHAPGSIRPELVDAFRDALDDRVLRELRDTAVELAHSLAWERACVYRSGLEDARAIAGDRNALETRETGATCFRTKTGATCNRANTGRTIFPVPVL